MSSPLGYKYEGQAIIILLTKGEFLQPLCRGTASEKGSNSDLPLNRMKKKHCRVFRGAAGEGIKPQPPIAGRSVKRVSRKVDLLYRVSLFVATLPT